jgi:hypothetical protein
MYNAVLIYVSKNNESVARAPFVGFSTASAKSAALAGFAGSSDTAMVVIV